MQNDAGQTALLPLANIYRALKERHTNAKDNTLKRLAKRTVLPTNILILHMKISDYSIQEIAALTTGDGKNWPYRTGKQLVDFFNDCGYRDTYGFGFQSRTIFAKEKISGLNGTKKLTLVMRNLLDSRVWDKHENLSRDSAVEALNKIIRNDGYEVHLDKNNFYGVRELKSAVIELENCSTDPTSLHELTIEEHILKCKEKIDSEDYTGAITNARSLVESVCRKIEADLTTNELPEYDGDLIKLFNRVKKLLNLDSSRKDITDSLKQVLTGLTSIVNGLSAMRNKMSDSHVLSYSPSRHHAKLAVNAAKTLSDFLFDTIEYQEKKGLLKK